MSRPPDTSVAVATTAPACYHAEGPLWDDRIERLVWVDQHAGLVHVARHRPGTATLEGEQTYVLGCAIGAIVPVQPPRSDWLVACAAGFASLSDDGELEMLAQPESDVADRNRMNDGKCDPQGRFWAGSMARDQRPGAGVLYRLDPDLAVRTMLTDVTISNGLAWSADGRRMYYIDTGTHRIDMFAFSARGEIAERRPLAVIDERDGVPDGMCIDEEGCLWVALWGGSQVRRYSPTGEIVGAISVDAPQVSSCCFGGGDRRTLFITTSQEDMGAARLERHPLSGRVFCARLEVGGPPADRFAWGAS
jgi:sugar lactone lactonase YvrE